MVALKTRAARSPAALAQRLFKLERCGRYEDALDEASHIWPDHFAEPHLEDFSFEAAAELRLRLGAVVGFHGQLALTNGLQEVARDLLSRAKREFGEIGSVEKVAECNNYLALTYWRRGENEDAPIYIDEALNAGLPKSSPVYLYSCIIKCLIGMSSQTDADNLKLLDTIEEEVWRHGDDCLKGDFFSHRSTAFDNTDQTDEALRNFELAMHFFRRARHSIYLGIVANNLAWFFKKHRDFPRAYGAIESAIETFRAAKDKTREGFTLDTKAALLLAEGKTRLALEWAEKALEILEQSENAQYRIDTYLTKCQILLAMNNFQDAVFTLIEAVDLAKGKIGEGAARRLIDGFEKAYLKARDREKKVLSRESTAGLNLLLPESIAHYEGYRGMRVTNDHLAALGLEKGALAVIACCDVARGDLAVVSTIETNEVSCGIYDEFAGIISLEDPAGGEPRLFNQDQVRILGKIVGRGDESMSGSGRIPVGPLVT